MFKLNKEQGKPDKTGLKPNQVWYSNAKPFLNTLKETLSSAITMILVTHISSHREYCFPTLNLFANTVEKLRSYLLCSNQSKETSCLSRRQISLSTEHTQRTSPYYEKNLSAQGSNRKAQGKHRNEMDPRCFWK